MPSRPPTTGGYEFAGYAAGHTELQDPRPGGQQAPDVAPKKVRSFTKSLLDESDTRKGQVRKPFTIKTSQGSILIDDLDVPEDIKDLLESLDFDDDLVVQQHEFDAIANLLKKLKEHLDAADAGALKKSMELVVRLVESKKVNSTTMEYSHLPENIQAVFRVWDLDGGGSVDSSELNSAAQSYEKMLEEGRTLKKCLIAATITIILMMAGMFFIATITAELSKEFKAGTGDDAARMVAATSGLTIQTANSETGTSSDGALNVRKPLANVACPKGTTCHRLNEKEDGEVDGTVRVAQTAKQGKLASTLPDTTFAQIKMLTLTGTSNATLKLDVQSFQRVRMRSSLCGSVVKLTLKSGTLTLDDLHADADDVLLKRAQEVGLGNIFRHGSPLGNGWRLSADSGGLSGFFNTLDNIKWECKSQPLKKPELFNHNYVAEVLVKQAHTPKDDNGLSEYFVDNSQKRVEIAGILRENGRVLQSYHETTMSLGSVSANLKRYVMSPYTQFLSIKQKETEMTMAVEGGTAYNCLISNAADGNVARMTKLGDQTMAFMGVVQEDGVIARRFRIHLTKQSEKLRRLALENGGYVGGRRMNQDDEAKALSMFKTGTVPNYMDYYDIDSDESGGRQPGDPYRVVFGSTVPSSKIYTETTYLSITPMASTVDAGGILDHFGILEIQNTGTAKCPCELEKGASDNGFCSAALTIPDAGSSKDAPLPLLPYTELQHNLLQNFERLYAENKENLIDPSQPQSGALKFALGNRFWQNMLQNGMNRLTFMRDLKEALNKSSGATSKRRPLLKKSKEAWRQGEDTWEFKAEIKHKAKALVIDITAGPASINFEATWKRGGQLTGCSGSASGSAQVWLAPVVTMSFEGTVSLKNAGKFQGAFKVEVAVDIVWGLGFSVSLDIIGAHTKSDCLAKIYTKFTIDLWAVEGSVTFNLLPLKSCDYSNWQWNVQASYEACVSYWCWDDVFPIAGSNFH